MSTREESFDRHGVKCELFAEVLRSSGMARLRVMGTSMIPAVWPGDLLTVRRVEISQVVPGEIVLFTRDRRLFAHRVREKASHGEGVLLITRGDRLSQDDAAVSSSELLGRVTSIIRAQTAMTPSIGTTVKGRLLAAISRYSEWPVQVLLHLYSLRHKNAKTNFRWDEQEQEVN